MNLKKASVVLSKIKSLFCLTLTIFSCSSSQKEFINEPVKEKNENLGLFSIRLLFDNTANKSLDKVLIKIAKSIPKNDYNKVYSAPLAPIPIITEHEEVKLPIVNEANAVTVDAKLIQDKPIDIFLEEGEYYVSLDTFSLRELIKFDPIENPILFISLGYSYDEDFKNIANYNDVTCVNEHARQRKFFLENKNICRKLIIKKGNNTKLNIYGRERSLNYAALIFKWIPGIIILAPFINFEYYFRRKYEVELINPE